MFWGLLLQFPRKEEISQNLIIYPWKGKDFDNHKSYRRNRKSKWSHYSQFSTSHCQNRSWTNVKASDKMEILAGNVRGSLIKLCEACHIVKGKPPTGLPFLVSASIFQSISFPTGFCRFFHLKKWKPFLDSTSPSFFFPPCVKSPWKRCCSSQALIPFHIFSL